MSVEKPNYGPYLEGEQSRAEDLHHRRARDLPGFIAQRVDALESQLDEIKCTTCAGKEATSEVSLQLASCAAGHEAAVCSLLTFCKLCAERLGMELKVTQSRRVR